ncbi:MAG: hypothetical protein J7M25_18350 [Deltaproteobacteria bacterium]|nr:hypothetical protein [Deltaproteobacteria bacterium]
MWLEGEPRRALTHFLAAAAADPGSLPPLRRAAECLVVLGLASDARRMLQHARRVVGRRPIWFDLARARVLSKGGLRSSSISARTSEDFVRAAVLWRMAGRSDREAGALRRALRLAPDDLEAMIRLGWWARRAGQSRQAVGLFQRSVASHPEYLMGYVQEAFSWIDMGRYDEARLRIQMARQQAPANLDLAIVAWRIALAVGRSDRARAVLSSLASYHGAPYRLFRAHRLADQGQWREAIVGLDQVSSPADAADAQALLLRAALAHGRRREALDRFGRLVALGGSVPQLGDVVQRVVRYGFCREALGIIKKSVHLPDDRHRTWRCRRMGYRILARSYLEASCGDRNWSRRSLGVVHWNCGTQRGLGYLMAVVADRAGWMQRAWRIVSALIAREPDDASALNLYGYTMANHGRAAESVGILRIAHLLDPLDPAVADSYGWALLLAGRRREAEGLLAFAWRLLPVDGEIAAHRGWAVEVAAGASNRVGRVNCREGDGMVQAGRWYRRALRLRVAPEVRRWVRMRLAAFAACRGTGRKL